MASSPSVNDFGARNKMDRMLADIQAKIAAAMPAVAEALVVTAVGRAPTVDQEYNILMEGEGKTSDVPRAGDRSGDTDERIRLQKKEDTYLANAIPKPENILITPTSVSFGSLTFLNSQTHYSYVNWSSREGQIPHGPIGPYFEAFEAGAVTMMTPRFQRTGSGSDFYPLRPDEINKYRSMFKPITGRNMFDFFTLDAVARAALAARLSELDSGRP